MLFNSITFIVFLAVIVSLYWSLPRTPRLYLVFISSLVFYGFWRIEFIPIMLVSVVTDYVVALAMANVDDNRKRRWYLIFSLFVNLGLLFYFKYLLFFAENAIGFANIVGMEASLDPFFENIILPLGISFYTFQTISYTVDVYRKIIKPERNFILYASYVTFFPQLVAGPILRAVEVIPQLSERVKFNVDIFSSGIRRILYGLFLKVVIADNIAPLVDAGFAIPLDQMSALDVWTLSFLFGFQIYFDFSAYSHIAIGAARLMGITFPENFNFPYMAVSPRDFWRRWHISLSSWIRDYLYLPLAGIKVHDKSIGGLGNVVERGMQYKSLFITWALMGLWHGASWTFVVWGLYHALVITVYRLIKGAGKQLPHQFKLGMGWFVTAPIMMLGWIPFRAKTLDDAIGMFQKVFQPSEYLWMGMRENTYLVTFVLTILMMGTYFTSKYLVPLMQKKSSVWLLGDACVYSVVISLVFVFLRPINQFIYFQF